MPRDAAVHALLRLRVERGVFGRIGGVHIVCPVQVIEHGRELVGTEIAVGHKEPELVALDRTAERWGNIHDVIDVPGFRETLRPQGIGHVIGLHRFRREVAEDVAPKRVASRFRHHVEEHAARFRFRRQGRILQVDFLCQVLRRLDADAAVRDPGHLRHPVDHQLERVGRTAVIDQLRRVAPGRTADVVPAGVPRTVDAGNQFADRRIVPAGRDRLERRLGQDRLLRHVLEVDNWRGSRHRNRFREIADLELSIHGGGKPRRDLHVLPHQLAETGQRERDGIRARPQLDDPVLPIITRDDAAYPFDQRRARHFHRDAWQDAAGRITNLTGDHPIGLLRGDGARNEREYGPADGDTRSHTPSFGNSMTGVLGAERPMRERENRHCCVEPEALDADGAITETSRDDSPTCDAAFPTFETPSIRLAAAV